jgi:hypothetical protein
MLPFVVVVVVIAPPKEEEEEEEEEEKVFLGSVVNRSGGAPPVRAYKSRGTRKKERDREREVGS